MPSTSAYSLLPTSASGSSEQLDVEDISWQPELSPNRGWFSLTAFVATRRSRFARRPYTVSLAAISTLCVLGLLTVAYDHSFVSEWFAPPPREHVLRDCFELPMDELEWRTTQLPLERSELCPFDPEPFVVLREDPAHRFPTSRQYPWSNQCLEDMLASGQVQPRSCDTTQKEIQAQSIDLVWTWVNGSSTLLELTRQDRIAEISGMPPTELESESVAGLAAKLFRDHDELRYSVRAALKHFGTDAKADSNFFIVGSDLPTSVHGFGMDDDPDTAEVRVGQLPSWLGVEGIGVDGAFTSWNEDGRRTRLQVNHHRDIFSRYDGTVFNSLAIESQFSNLGRIGVSDIFVYVNDDVFFGRDLSSRDFYMAEQGIVMRMQYYIAISPDPSIPQHDGLEWESLQYSNSLLSTRFGRRLRPYPAHLAKSLSIPMLREVSRAWPHEVARVESNPFRGMRHMDLPGSDDSEEEPADMYMVFMEHHWIVERWREGLLWSWVVARGESRTASQGESGSDKWTKVIAQQAWRELGGELNQGNLTVRRAKRQTLENADEWAGTKATTLVFSSLDGYPYSEDMGERGWVSEGDVCELQFDFCFGLHDSASRVFQRVAFEEPVACGDCIIRALVNKSGERGLEAFLPPRSDAPHKNSLSAPPTLPISSSWQTSDFRLSNVLKAHPGEVNTRQFVLQMLQRYRFVLGDTPFMFAIVTDPNSAKQNVDSIASNPSLAILCVNDDVAEGDGNVREILGGWMSATWNRSAGWERAE